MTTYSTREAQAKMGEILQKLKEGERVLLLDEGEPVAEIRPVEISSDEVKWLELIEEGSLEEPAEPRGDPGPFAESPGALARFLESRR